MTSTPRPLHRLLISLLAAGGVVTAGVVSAAPSGRPATGALAKQAGAKSAGGRRPPPSRDRTPTPAPRAS